jgi:hypothetical protein
LVLRGLRRYCDLGRLLAPPLSRRRPLQFASFGMVSFRGDLHPQDDVHARRTTKTGHLGAPFLLARKWQAIART